jgi:ribosome recycling factor
MTQDILKATKVGMEKGVENAKREFSTVRTGKASPNMLDTVQVIVGAAESGGVCLGTGATHAGGDAV